MADNRIAYGMLKKAGVDTEGMCPKEAWDKLKKLGIEPPNQLPSKGKHFPKIKLSPKEQSQRAKQAKDPKHSPDLSYRPKDSNEIAGVLPGNPMSFDRANSNHVNPYYGCSGLYGYDDNCQICVAVFEARLRGYDVRALPNNMNDTIRILERNHAFLFLNEYGKAPEPFERLKGESDWEYINKWIHEGKRYTLKWDNRFQDDSHVISVMRKNGRILFYDPQIGQKYNGSQINKLLKSIVPKSVQILRIDNLAFNDKYIHNVMKRSEQSEPEKN